MKSNLTAMVPLMLGFSGSVWADTAALAQAEMQALSAQVAPCWNIGALDKEETKAVVTVEFALTQKGIPVRDSLRLIGAGKDTSATVLKAYDAAKRAIIRCGAEGYKLPLEKYPQWQSIELTFNPERMFLQ